MPNSEHKSVISVVIPCFNDCSTLQKTVESVMSQGVSNVQVIIVDDASTDGTDSLIRQLTQADRRIRSVTHQSNRKSFASRRDGTLAADGEYILFLDADDELAPGTLSALLDDIAKNGSADFVAFSIDPIYSSPVPEAQRDFDIEFLRCGGGTFTGPEIAHSIFVEFKTPFSMCAKLFKRDVALKAFETLGNLEGVFQAEDSAFTFAVSLVAASYRGIPELRGYRYNIQTGESRKFENVCQSGLVLPHIRKMLDTCNAWDEHASDYNALEYRLVEETASYILQIPPEERRQARELALQYWDEDILSRMLCAFPGGLRDMVATGLTAMQFDDVANSGCWSPVDIATSYARAFWLEPFVPIDRISHADAFKRSGKATKSIAVYHHKLSMGGADRVTRDLVELWSRMGYTVTLITDEDPSENDLPLAAGISRVVIPDFRTLDANSYRKRGQAIRDIIVERGIDTVVYCQWMCTTIPWDVMTMKLLGAKVIVHAHGAFSMVFELPDYCYAEYTAAYELADGVVCLSNADASFWKSFNSNVAVTVNPFTFSPESTAPADLNDENILWIGRLDEAEKNPLDAIRAMEGVIDEFPNAHLDIVGPDQNSYRAFLESQIAELGLSRNITIHEETLHPEQFYSKSSVYLLTSPAEGYCLSLAEAKTFGVPVVMYDLPYLKLVEGHRGILASPFGDTRQLADNIKTLLRDEDVRRQVGCAAREHMLEMAGFSQEEFWHGMFGASDPADEDDTGQAGQPDEAAIASIAWKTAVQAHSSCVKSLYRDLGEARGRAATAESDLHDIQERRFATRIADAFFPLGSKRGEAIRTMYHKVRKS